ncbi:MAG: XTP/dITP diphosphatase [Sulfolobales archaeon]|nr:XTP/dITP diphosphatase [Sulfolobales archaeon]MDW7968822.1 XTP/dITP diphosphatase [Sulfolobales archaeon]
MSKVVYIVTSNPGKFNELKFLAAKNGIELVPIDAPKLEIQSEDLEVVASYAALTASTYVGKALMVEDSGLFIKALNGFPGSMSSYVFRKLGVEGILKLMNGVVDREAFFKSVIAYSCPESGVKLFHGVVYGEISNSAVGSGGFGFDPIFIPKGCSRTFAEMSLEEKNELSHRGIAFMNFAKWFNNVFKQHT